MIPGVPVPDDAVRTPVEVKLRPGWSYDTGRRRFVSDAGETFAPRGELPRNTRIVYKVPGLAAVDEAHLSEPERDLRRYLQVILPRGEAPRDYVDAIREWPSVAEASVGPQVSLP